MQGINATIKTPVFAFFGSLALPALAALFTRRRSTLMSLVGAVVVDAAGVIAITFLVHVPMNDALAVVSVPTVDAQAVWADYAVPWIAWNHVRAIAAAVTFGFVLTATIGEWRNGQGSRTGQ